MSVFSRHYVDFHIAGTRFWDCALVIHDIQVGDSLTLTAEANNPHDPDSVALLWQGTKLGYVPRGLNELPAQLLRFGHTQVLECRVLKVDPQAEPWEQVHVGLYFVDRTSD